MEKKRYNEEFIDLMEKMSNIMVKQGEQFKARAYQKAKETIISYFNDIYDPFQLKGLPGIGLKILNKLIEYAQTGTLKVLENEKINPINIFSEIYGIGPKKSEELVNSGIKTINDLRSRQHELLNNSQIIGLKYYEQLQEKIPRKEILEFEQIFKSTFIKISKDFTETKCEIVGSYRRGSQTSGDIDLIITGNNDKIHSLFIDELLKKGIILELLCRGKLKTLVIAKLPGKNMPRRVDFLFSPIDEFAFAILYFTGSKIFNTVMRQHALNKGYTFNEHCMYKLENNKKVEKVCKKFNTEKEIFDFLGLEFKSPTERHDGRCIVIL